MKNYSFTQMLTCLSFLIFSTLSHSLLANSNDSLLLNAEDKVFQAFVSGKIEGTPQKLNELSEQLEGLFQNSKQPLAAYWLAYNQYYQTIFYMMSEDKANAKTAVKFGIKLLKGLEKKSSEDYALLASLQSLSIPLYSMVQAIAISSKVNKNGQKALQMDKNNLRAHLVLGSSDYYKPTQYGGGKKVEKYLLEAIRLPRQQVTNPYLPSWGKNTAYEVLIRFYLREDRKEDAKAMFKKATAEFPNDYQINQLAKELI